jgi:DNA gyrase/topoisomerase IV subunit A
LTAELTELTTRLEALQALIESEPARSKYMLAEIKQISKKFGEPRRSQLIDIPEGFAKQNDSARVTSAPKPRFVKIDLAKGVVTQEKGPRGCLLLETTDKLITITQNGTIKKLASNFKGTLDVGYVPVLLGQKESKVVTNSYLVVFKLEENLKAMVVLGEDLARTTSKGKNLLAPGAEIVYFGEKSHTVHFVSGRKKPVVLTLETKQGKPGGKGIKIANLADVQTGV